MSQGIVKKVNSVKAAMAETARRASEGLMSGKMSKGIRTIDKAEIVKGKGGVQKG